MPASISKAQPPLAPLATTSWIGCYVAPMNRLVIRLTVLVASVVVMAISCSLALASSYCDPLGGCAQLKASPGTVKAGRTVALSGSVGAACRKPAQVTLSSSAFRGATRHRLGSVPAVSAQASRKGSFSTRVKLSRTIRRGAYQVAAHCGRSSFASARLKVS